jgi:3-oxoacyl-[acyl-carrier protein] reductase
LDSTAVTGLTITSGTATTVSLQGAPDLINSYLSSGKLKTGGTGSLAVSGAASGTITVTQAANSSVATALLSPIDYIKAVSGPMMARRWGRIVNISTGAAKYPAAMRVLSGPPRAALANYCHAISKELVRKGVTINSVLPGMHHTPGIEDMLGPRAAANGRSYDEDVAAFVKAARIPAGRFGAAEDLGALVTMLCSAQASFVTGQSLVADGGIGSSIF